MLHRYWPSSEWIGEHSALGRKWLSESQTVKFIATVGEVLGKLTVFGAIVLWLWEIPDRAQQRRSAAWTTINLSQGKLGQAGRIDALESLNGDGISLSNMDFSNASLTGVRLPGADLSRSIFGNTDLSHADFQCPSSFLRKLFSACRGASFVAAKFHDVAVFGANFDHSDFSYAKISGKFYHRDLVNPTVDPARITNSKFFWARFSDVQLIDIDMTGSIFQDTSFKKVEFRNVILDGAIFLDSDLTESNAYSWKLTGALLCHTKTPDSRNPVDRDCEKIAEILKHARPYRQISVPVH